MADDKFLRKLAFDMSSYRPAESPPTFATSDSDEDYGHVQEAQSAPPEETQTVAVAAGHSDRKRRTSSSDGASHDRKKRRTRSPTHSVPEETQAVAAAADQTVNVEERTRFLESVKGRFPPEDDPDEIHGKMLDTMVEFQRGRLKKKEAHARACILLIGHSDLLQAFERLLKHDDEPEDWRSDVMIELMRGIDMFLKNGMIAENQIGKGLAEVHLRCIERLIEDFAERNALVADLRNADPSDASLLRWNQKVEDVIERMKDFLSAYFGRELDYATLHDGDPSTSLSGDIRPPGY